MLTWSKRLSALLVSGGAAIVLVAAPAAASGGSNPNPNTGCIAANNMMTDPGMAVWGSHNNPGGDPSGSGMYKAMVVSDALWPNMGC